MYCSHCGKQIPDDSNVCPYCANPVLGEAPDPIPNDPFSNTPSPYQQPVPKQTNSMAIAGLICAFISPLLGWIFGGLGLKKANEINQGRGMSIAAIVIASVLFLLSFLVTISQVLY